MKLKLKKMTAAVLMASIVTTCVAGCGSSGSAQKETVDLNSMSLEEITAKAQEEGEVNSVGMPDDWANWDDTWSGI